MPVPSMSSNIGSDNIIRPWALLLCGVGLTTLIYWLSTRKSNKKIALAVLLAEEEATLRRGLSGMVPIGLYRPT